MEQRLTSRLDSLCLWACCFRDFLFPLLRFPSRPILRIFNSFRHQTLCRAGKCRQRGSTSRPAAATTWRPGRPCHHLRAPGLQLPASLWAGPATAAAGPAPAGRNRPERPRPPRGGGGRRWGPVLLQPRLGAGCEAVALHWAYPALVCLRWAKRAAGKGLRRCRLGGWRGRGSR